MIGQKTAYAKENLFFLICYITIRIWCIRRGGSRPLARTSGEAPQQTRDYVWVLSFFFYARELYRLTAINASGKTHSRLNVWKEAPRQTRDRMLVLSFFIYIRTKIVCHKKCPNLKQTAFWMPFWIHFVKKHQTLFKYCWLELFVLIEYRWLFF